MELAGGSRGKARLLFDLGAEAVISKRANDGSKLIFEVLVSTASDAFPRGTAWLVGFLFVRVAWAQRYPATLNNR